MRRVLLAAAAVLAAVVLVLLITLPPPPAATSGTLVPEDRDLIARTVPGAYHVHTTRSDGAGDPATIARAAAKAGLRFVIFTDHGDGTREPDAPVYREGVLCLDGVEISTTGGHYVALDMPGAPYPLGGEPSAVVEDVARLGGFGIAAHPDSPKPELAWTDWHAAIDGIEWLSADTEWRNESRGRLARVVFDYFVRPAASLASTLDRPTATLQRWDAEASRRPLVALAAHDAHGGMHPRVEGGSRMGLSGLPSYEASFRTFAIRAVLGSPPSGNAAADARLVFDAIRRGRVFTAVDAIAAPAYLDFHAITADGAHVPSGGAIEDPAATLSARAAAPDGATIVLLRNGVAIAQRQGRDVEARAEGPGAYRIEIRARRAPGTPPVPWLLSNPIYVDLPPAAGTSVPDITYPVLDLRDCAWHVEKDGTSRATLVSGPAEGRVAYHLGNGGSGSQFVALACDLPPPTPSFDAVEFRVRSEVASRISVQLRFARDGERRWRRSVYADATARAARVHVKDLVPAERDGVRPPEAARATSVLFVIDLTNARPGSAGEFSIRDLRLTTPARYSPNAAR